MLRQPLYIALVAAATILAGSNGAPIAAQQPLRPELPGSSVALPTATTTGTNRMAEADRLAAEALAAENAKAAEVVAPPKSTPAINLWQLAIDGGILMIPIVGCSVFVVCFAFERWFGLRRRKLMPPALVRELGELARRQGGVDPRAAYRACMRYPSTASTVIRAVLLKIGRPHAELEQTLREVNEREAAKLYRNVRPIELQISVAPLLGLLGTVQGMIMAFFVTANSTVQVNRAEQLAQGIYVALVTTFAGLCVAIPAAVLAHYFEGRIQKLFSDLDEFVLGMLPQWERFEGKLRVNRATLAGETEHTTTAEPAESAGERATVKSAK
ncbi:MAG: MotA/TolQ/ExbB proton channel family protein [Planctomycetaceae bacterium]|nr:MotA/TolQ/ExbB proton channel family protein [Planctomycetaceae bacterium]